MKLIDKIKNYIAEKKEPEDNNQEQTYCIYDLIIKELIEYSNEIDTIIKLKLDADARKKEVTKKILNLIEEDDRVLRIQDGFGKNIGMEAAKLDLEDVVIRALDDDIASLQVDDSNKNIGIYAVKYRLENASLKA